MPADSQRTTKFAERKLKGGVVVEYFYTVGGPSVEACMDKVAKVAAEAIIRKTAYNRS